MDIGVIGGGYLGTLVAIGLARRGAHVTLYDARLEILQGASFVGEGKIHLGLVYALGDVATSESMLRGALSFDSALEYLLTTHLDWSQLRGETFDYLVADDSLVSECEFLSHAQRLDVMRRSLVDQHEQATYLGGPLETCIPVPHGQKMHRFTSHERYVNTSVLAQVVRDSVAETKSLRIKCGTRIVAPEPKGEGWILRLRESDGSPGVARHDTVVNCTWEDSARLDIAAGMTAEIPNLRLRAFVHGRSSSAPMAITIVHGPYGDVVIRPDGTFYGSWYPTGLLGFAVSDSVPHEWNLPFAGCLRSQDVLESILLGLKTLLPELGTVLDPQVHARIVVAGGETDIGDPGSALHRREDGAVLQRDNWISPRARKLTTIPSTARAVVQSVEAALQ